MSKRTEQLLAKLDAYIDARERAGRDIVLRLYERDHAAIVKSRKGEAFTSYRGYPVVWQD